MNRFECMTIENALKKVKSNDDAFTIAQMLMKLTDSPKNPDAVFYTAERNLLALLIEREVSIAKEPSFSNIRNLAEENNLEERLRDSEPWTDFVSNTTENFRKLVWGVGEQRNRKVPQGLDQLLESEAASGIQR